MQINQAISLCPHFMCTTGNDYVNASVYTLGAIMYVQPYHVHMHAHSRMVECMICIHAGMKRGGKREGGRGTAAHERTEPFEFDATCMVLRDLHGFCMYLDDLHVFFLHIFK